MRNEFAIIVSTLMLLLTLGLWAWAGAGVAFVALFIVIPIMLVLLVSSGRSRNPHGRRAMTIEPNTRAPIVLGGEFEKSIRGTAAEKHAIALSLQKRTKVKGRKPNRKGILRR